MSCWRCCWPALAGLLFSPIAARLRGIYLGVASLGLVFIGQHVLNSADTVTGGFNGRAAPGVLAVRLPLRRPGPAARSSLGVPFGEDERLWYLGSSLALAAYLFARNLLRGRPGRALQTLRDSEVAAAVMGVNVQRYKAGSFLVSSMYAGLAGVMFALAFGSIAPESFGLELSIQYLAMIVIGGLGSVGGAALGRRCSSPRCRWSSSGTPTCCRSSATPGQSGLAAGEAARFLYGSAIVAGDPLRARRPGRAGRTVPTPRPGPRRGTGHGWPGGPTSAAWSAGRPPPPPTSTATVSTRSSWGHATGSCRVFGADGTLRWAKPVVPPGAQGAVAVDSSPTVADVDGDGQPEILVGAGSLFVPGQPGGLVVFDRSGNVKWSQGFNDIFRSWDPSFGTRPDGLGEFLLSSPVVGDVNGDGHPDVVVAPQDNRVYAFDGRDGSPVPGWVSEVADQPGPGYWVDDAMFSTPVLFDADHDGRDEVYVGVTATPGGSINHSGGVLVALEYLNGRAHMKWVDTYDDVIVSSPAIGDIDGDGRPDLVFGAGIDYGRTDPNRQAWRQVFAVHADDGSGLGGWPKTTNGDTEASVALGDLDGDGVPEVVAVTNPMPSGDGQVYAWKGNGTQLWAVTPNRCYDYGCEGGGGMRAAPVIADLDGDGAQDVAVSNGWGTFLLRGSDGARLGDAIESGRTNQAGLAVGSFGGRRRMLIVPTYLNGASTVAAVPLAASSVAPQWPQFHHDAARTGRHPSAKTGGFFVGIEPTPSGGGYWLVTASGEVQAKGDATVLGSANGLGGGELVSSISATPSGRGLLAVHQPGPGDHLRRRPELRGHERRGVERPRARQRRHAVGPGLLHGRLRRRRVRLRRRRVRRLDGRRPAERAGAVARPRPRRPRLLAGGVRRRRLRLRRRLPRLDGRRAAQQAGQRDGALRQRLRAPRRGRRRLRLQRPAFSGSLGANPPALPVIDIAVVPQGDGYWMLDAGGTVYAFGNARVF